MHQLFSIRRSSLPMVPLDQSMSDLEFLSNSHRRCLSSRGRTTHTIQFACWNTVDCLSPGQEPSTAQSLCRKLMILINQKCSEVRMSFWTKYFGGSLVGEGSSMCCSFHLSHKWTKTVGSKVEDLSFLAPHSSI